LERALSQARTERTNLTALLDTRTAELKEAQTYLSKVDDISDSEVLHLLEHLNSQIFQTAAKIANDLQSSYGTQTNGVVRKEAVGRLEKSTMIGPDLPRFLYICEHQRDPILVQIALQALLATYLYYLAAPWSTWIERRLAFLQSIYAEMCKHEPQSVFGRWRTMTLTYMRAVLPGKTLDPSVSARRLAEEVSDVLLACGIEGSIEDTGDLVRQRYGKGLRALTAQALDFRQIVGVRIMSGDLHPLIVWPNDPFAQEWMEDEWKDPKDPSSIAPSRAHVCCTTTLGLVRKEQ
ncbi:hypothetical protein BD414DRAFT_379910, partial [Trametes punicea]